MSLDVARQASVGVVAILAPHGRDAVVARDILAAEGLRAVAVDGLAALAASVGDGLGCALVTEEALAGEGGGLLAETLAAQPSWSDVPFVVLSNGSTRLRTPAARARLDALHNAVLLPRPLHADELVRAIGSALAARARQHDTRRHLEELGRREAQLVASETEFQAIADSVDQMIWTTRADGFHDYYNRRWYEFTGVPEGTTDGDGWSGLTHEDDRARAWATWWRSLETGATYEIEYRLRHASGAYRWVLGRAQPTRDASGAILRWYGTCTDIDDEVAAREAVASELRQQRDTAWDLSPDLLTVAALDGTILAANGAWTRLLGYPVDALVGTVFTRLVHADDLDATMATYATIPLMPRLVPYEFRLRHAAESYRWFAWTALCVDGRVYATGRDVTEARAQATQLAAAETQLRQAQKLETLGQLTGGIAHDFNNLLMAIRSSLDLLGRRLPAGDGRALGYLDNARQAADRGARLTQRMLAFARRQELRPEIVDVAALLPGLRDLMTRTVGPQVEVVLAVEPGVPPALVDANQLEMAVLNLAVNARDAMDGVGRLTVSLGRIGADGSDDLAPGDYVRVAVTDEGTGMDAATLGQAMEPFFTTKGVGRGTGLGLPMVHGLAKQSGGTFRLESAPGRGTTATLVLPASVTAAGRAAAPPAAPRPNEADAEAVPAAGRRRVILAVDDDALVLMGTAGLLEDMGHEVIEAHSGAAALDALAARPEIDLVVTDQAMPRMTGVELAGHIRAARPDLPVILATGYAEMPEGAGDRIAARLEKPFASAQLERLLATIP